MGGRPGRPPQLATLDRAHVIHRPSPPGAPIGRRIRSSASLAVALAMALGAGCGSGPSAETPDVPVHRVKVPFDDYQGKAWIRPDLVVVGNPNQEELGEPVLLWSVRLSDGHMERLPINQDDPDCTLTEYMVPTSLPDGRLGFVKYCATTTEEPFQYSIGAYDLDTGQVEFLGPRVSFLAPAQFDWNPSAGRAIVSKSNRLCATIAWVTPQGFEYLSARIQDEEGSFSLDEGYTDVDPGCTKGRADWPAWSPDGKQIAFFASPRSVGVEGMDRAFLPWNLYLMDPEEQQPRKVLDGITDPVGLRWSPDSTWLAFSGELGGEGTWVFQPTSGRLVRVAEDQIGPAWSPDGTRLVGLVEHGDESPARRELLIVDVARIVEGE